MTTYWCEHAWIGGAPCSGVRLTVSGERFAAVETGVPAAPADDILPGLVLPGFANVHSHTFHRALRGLAGTGDSFWKWRDTMYRVAGRLDPDAYYEFARLAYREMLAAGYTAVGEFHYVHHQADGTPYANPNATGAALIAAAHDAGIRLTLLDTLYLSSGFGAPLEPLQQRFGDGTVDAWLTRVGALTDDPTTRIGAAIHSIRAVSPIEAGRVAAWAQAGDRPLHVHLSEQVRENERCQEQLGTTPTQALAAVGVWGRRTTAVHATHLTDADIAVLGEGGTLAGICPSTEADLADGVPRLAELTAAGTRVCIGSDQNVLTDGLREVQGLETAQRLLHGTRENLDAAHQVEALTAHGQFSLGWDDAGRIEPGALADFVVIDTRRVALAGCQLPEVPRCASTADVAQVFVGGQDRTPADAEQVAAELDTRCRALRAETASAQEAA